MAFSSCTPEIKNVGWVYSIYVKTCKYTFKCFKRHSLRQSLLFDDFCSY